MVLIMKLYDYYEYRVWLNKGPGAYWFEKVQTPGAYLNPTLIWTPV